jgi:hypothetical protein
VYFADAIHNLPLSQQRAGILSSSVFMRSRRSN